MRRGAKPGKTKVKARLPVARKARKSDGSRVRGLEKRLAEALAQQTATSEILGVISRSPTDVQPIFDVIVRSAVRLTDALFSTVILAKGDTLQLGAAYGFTPDALASMERSFPASRDVDLPSAQAIREGSVVQLPDAQASRFGALARMLGFGPSGVSPSLAETWGRSLTGRSRC
jgi:hypothetical protein